MVEKQGGTVANNTGQNLEAFIENALIRHGYQFVDKAKFKPSIYLEQPIYSKQVFICKSIYDTNVYCDFILYHPEKYPDCLIIESKWQQTGGSVDEKYPDARIFKYNKDKYAIGWNYGYTKLSGLFVPDSFIVDDIVNLAIMRAFLTVMGDNQ